MTDTIYEALRRRGLTASQRDFSTRWAGRSPSYLATRKTLSADAMLAVLGKLMAERRWLLAFQVAREMLFGKRRAAA